MKTLWQVEWIESVPKDECGDAIIDAADYRTRRFPSKPLALAFAAQVIIGKPWEVADLYPVRQVTPAEIRASYESEDGPLDYWREGRELWARVGDKEEVAS